MASREMWTDEKMKTNVLILIQERNAYCHEDRAVGDYVT